MAPFRLGVELGPTPARWNPNLERPGWTPWATATRLGWLILALPVIVAAFFLGWPLMLVVWATWWVIMFLGLAYLPDMVARRAVGVRSRRGVGEDLLSSFWYVLPLVIGSTIPFVEERLIGR
jgi:hypothetical protein